jgi:hypothetical protein
MPARTRQDPQKNNRAALALARKAISTFSGELAAPIVVVEEEIMGLLSPMFADEESRRRRAAKFEALFDHYQIKTTDKDKWKHLSVQLACDIVPGMQVLRRRKTKRGPKEKRVWTTDRLMRFADGVDAIRKEKCTKIFDAICEFVHRNRMQWGHYKKQERSLVQHYHAGKRLMHRQKALKPPDPLWKEAERIF